MKGRMTTLPDGEQIWIFIFAMLFSAVSWLGKFLRNLSGEEHTSIAKLGGGLIGSTLLGFVVASLLITYMRLEPVIVWTASIMAGALGEKVTYGIIAAVIKSKTGLPLDFDADKKEEEL